MVERVAKCFATLLRFKIVLQLTRKFFASFKLNNLKLAQASACTLTIGSVHVYTFFVCEANLIGEKLSEDFYSIGSCVRHGCLLKSFNPFVPNVISSM